MIATSFELFKTGDPSEGNCRNREVFMNGNNGTGRLGDGNFDAFESLASTPLQVVHLML